MEINDIIIKLSSYERMVNHGSDKSKDKISPISIKHNTDYISFIGEIISVKLYRRSI